MCSMPWPYVLRDRQHAVLQSVLCKAARRLLLLVLMHCLPAYNPGQICLTVMLGIVLMQLRKSWNML